VGLAIKRDHVINLVTAADLRKAEIGIGEQIVKLCGNAPELIHDHIGTGFANYTARRYSVQLDCYVILRRKAFAFCKGVKAEDRPGYDSTLQMNESLTLPCQQAPGVRGGS
jgi:hypothetical protein